MTPGTLTLRPDTHPFFGDVVVVLAAAAALTQAVIAETRGSAGRYPPGTSGVFYGMPHVSNARVGYFPSQVLQPLSANSWPSEVTLVVEPLPAVTREEPGGISLDAAGGVTGVIARMMRSAFTSYYESVAAPTRFGRKPENWPPAWQFARIVRNAFAHNSRIHITDPKAKPVSWCGLTYRPSDNGREILFHDLSMPELLLLLLELNAQERASRPAV